jgi:periplasmic protein TonB
MKTDAILKADVLDIIFENRNKSYGAYTLRKFYNNRLYKALGAMGALVILLCSFTLLKSTKVAIGGLITDSVFIVKAVDLKEKKPEAPKVKVDIAITPKNKTVMASQIFTQVHITAHDVPTTIKTLDDDVAFGDKDIKLPVGGSISKVSLPTIGGGGTDSVKTPVKPVVDILTPTETAEVMPTYPGGMDALRKYLERNLQNPEEIEEGQTVSVKVRFVVGYDGALKNLQIVEDGGAAFNNEVLRVVKKMKAWNPGKTKGENVSVYYTIPIKFTTSN